VNGDAFALKTALVLNERENQAPPLGICAASCAVDTAKSPAAGNDRIVQNLQL
jgi:hypothetical protein